MEGMAEAPINQFLALCEVSRTIACHRTIPDLLHNLAPPLRRVIYFDFLAFILFDALRNVMQVHTLEKLREGTVALQPGTEFPADRSWTEWFRKDPYLRVIGDDHQAAQFAEVAQIARVRGVRSMCLLPLSTANRLIGALCFGSGEPQAHTSHDLEFLSTLAGQVALAVDNTLKDEDAQKEQKRAEVSLQASERRWRRVFENSAVGIALTDLEGRFETTNAAYQKLVGYTEEELRKLSFLDITIQEFRAQNRALIKDLLERRSQQFNIEKQYRRKDGSLVWARNNVSLIPGADGAPRYIMAIVEDISERKRAEEKLRRSEWSLLEAQRLGRSGSWSFNVASGIVTSSPEMFRQFDAKPDDDYWKPDFWFNRIHPEDRKRVRELFERCVIQKVDYQADYRIVLPDGTIKNQRSIGYPILNESGDLVEFVGTAIDVTEQHQARAALEKALADVTRSEDRLRLVIDTIPVLVARVRPDGSLDFINNRWLEFLGVPVEVVQDWGWTTLTHSEDIERFLRDWRLAMGSGEPFEGEARVRRADGQYRRLLVRAVPLRDDLGNIVNWYATGADIEDRKLAEDALRESEEETRLIVDTAPDAAITMDANGLVRRWNAAAEHMFGWAASEAMNRRMSELIIPPQYRQAYRQGLQKFFVTGEGPFLGKTIEVTALRRDGQEFPVELSVAPAKLGGAWVFNAFVRDVTERKRAESALHEAQAELAHVTRISTMGEFAASIAHEVSQPLAAIVANGDACIRWLNAEPADLDEARQSVRNVIRDANRASEVIKGVRGLAKKSALQLAPLSMNELIAEVIALARGEIQRNRALLTTELTPDLPFVLGDRVQLAQVLLNLLLNGMEAMSGVAPGQRCLVVGSRIGEPDEVVVYVRDCGAGISAEVMQNIFKPFFTTKPVGTGVGLSISRSIVEAHHGRLWTTPNEERGVTFAFSIPAVKP